MELELVKLLDTKDKYEKYTRLVDDSRLTPDVQDMYRSLRDYYKTTPPEPIEWVADWFPWYTIVKHPSLKEDKVTLLKEYTASLDTMAGPRPAVMQAFLERDVAAQVGDMSMAILDGDSEFDVSDIEELVTSYNLVQREMEEELTGTYLVSDNLEQDLKDSIIADTYEWRTAERRHSLRVK